METIDIKYTNPTKPHRCHSCGNTIPARARAIKYTKTTTLYTCMDCKQNAIPKPAAQTNFDAITASPEALATFLASLPTLSGPWDDAFHRKFCDACQAENCDACPHTEERNSPAWWLGLEVMGGECSL